MHFHRFILVYHYALTNAPLLLQQEEERAKKENTSPTKLPVVMEAQEPSEEAKTVTTTSDEKTEEPADTKVNTTVIETPTLCTVHVYTYVFKTITKKKNTDCFFLCEEILNSVKVWGYIFNCL